jgi:hypothetical protein
MSFFFFQVEAIAHYQSLHHSSQHAKVMNAVWRRLALRIRTSNWLKPDPSSSATVAEHARSEKLKRVPNHAKLIY